MKVSIWILPYQARYSLPRTAIRVMRKVLLNSNTLPPYLPCILRDLLCISLNSCCHIIWELFLSWLFHPLTFVSSSCRTFSIVLPIYKPCFFVYLSNLYSIVLVYLSLNFFSNLGFASLPPMLSCWRAGNTIWYDILGTKNCPPMRECVWVSQQCVRAILYNVVYRV